MAWACMPDMEKCGEILGEDRVWPLCDAGKEELTSGPGLVATQAEPRRA